MSEEVEEEWVSPAESSAATWPPDNPGWDYSVREDGSHQFTNVQAQPELNLGHMPHRAVVYVDVRGTGLKVAAVSASYSTVYASAVGSSVLLDGRFNHVELSQTNNVQACHVTAAQAPTKLRLGDGSWVLGGTRDRADRYRIELVGGGSAAVGGGNPSTISGSPGLLNLLAGITEASISVTGSTRVSAPCNVESVECSTLDLLAPLTTKLVRTRAEGGVPVRGGNGLETQVLDVKGSVHVSDLVADVVKITGGSLVATTTTLNDVQISAVGDYTVDESLAISPAQQMFGQGQVKVRQLTITGGGLDARELLVPDADDALVAVDKLIRVHHLTAAAPATVTASGMQVGQVSAEGAEFDLEHFHLLAGAASVTGRVDARTMLLAGPLTALSIHAEEAIVSAVVEATMEASQRCILGSTGSVSTLVARGDLTISSDAMVDHLTYQPASLPTCDLSATPGGAPTVAEPADADESDVSAAPASFVCDGEVGTLRIDASQRSARVSGIRVVPNDKRFRIQGRVTIRQQAISGQQSDARSLEAVTCGPGATRLTVEAAGVPVAIDPFEPEGTSTTLICKGEVAVLVRDPRTFRLDCNGDVRLSVAGHQQRVNVTAGGTGSLTIIGDVAQVESTGSRLRIDVPDGSIVRRAVGDWWLGDVGGWVAAGGYSIDELDRKDRGARLVKVGYDLHHKGVRATARISGFDMTLLSHQAIDYIGDGTDGAEIIEPDPKPIIRLARQHVVEGPGGKHWRRRVPRGDVRARAQWVLNLHQALENKATAGRDRASIGWAAARLQHRATFRGVTRIGGWEWWLRWLHRPLGYGYKMLPPFVVWVAASAVVAAYRIEGAWRFTWPLIGRRRVGGYCEPSVGAAAEPPWECAADVRDYLKELSHTGLFPFRLLRLSPDETPWEYLPGWAQPLAGIAVGVPFIFVLLAGKRLFALSHDK